MSETKRPIGYQIWHVAFTVDLYQVSSNYSLGAKFD